MTGVQTCALPICSQNLGRFPKFGKVPKFWEGSQNLGRFPKFGKVPKFWEGSQILGRFPKFGKVPKIWEGSQISEALQKGKEGIKLLQSNPTDLRALFLDHAGIHVLLLPRLPLVPCDPRVSCPGMHTKSTLETFVPKTDWYLLR